MIGYYPHSFFEGLVHAVTSGTQYVPLDSDDEAYRLWAEAMSQYGDETNAPGLKILNLWLVVRVDKEGFGDHIEMHEKLPMMIPKEGSGVLVGLARDHDELDAMLEQDTDKFVYLVYKIKIQGQKAWRDLLEFMGEHNMLDRDS